MRLNLLLTRNKTIVPFDYQSCQVGALHKWLGENDLHDSMSLYSFSWLNNGKKNQNGLDFPNGAIWSINFHDVHMVKAMIAGVHADNKFSFGMNVLEISIQNNPNFGTEHIFNVGSPIFIKQTIDKQQKFYFFNDPESTRLLTDTLKSKLRKAGLNADGVKVEFLDNYPDAKTKMCTYKGIKNIASVCPIKITGSPEQIAFAWDVGVGNSTGIGFGSLI